MKQLSLFVIIGLAILSMALYQSNKTNKSKYKEVQKEKDELIIKFDSILSLPPDTIEKPIIVIKDSIITVTKWFEKPNKPDTEAKIYKDSLITDSIDVRLKIYANKLYSVNYDYKPIFKYQEKVVEKKVPYSVEVIKKVKIPQSGFFVNAGLGFSDQFSGKVGLMLLTKKQTTYSFDLVRYGDKNIYIGSYGIKL